MPLDNPRTAYKLLACTSGVMSIHFYDLGRALETLLTLHTGALYTYKALKPLLTLQKVLLARPALAKKMESEERHKLCKLLLGKPWNLPGAPKGLPRLPRHEQPWLSTKIQRNPKLQLRRANVLLACGSLAIAGWPLSADQLGSSCLRVTPLGRVPCLRVDVRRGELLHSGLELLREGEVLRRRGARVQALLRSPRPVRP